MTGRIPQSFIDDLLARVDIVEVIGERLALRKAGRNYQALCPFHNERSPSFSVSPEKQFYYCFGCGASGSALGFLMNHDRLDFLEAVEELASMAGVEVPREAATARRADALEPLYAQLERAERHFGRQLREHPAAERAREYLKGRGLSGQVAAEFGLGYAPPGWDNLLRALGDSTEATAALERAGLLVRKDEGGHYDRFRDRIMFPIRDQRGRVVGFGGRVLGAEEPKYLNSPETPVFHKGRELYGLYQARRSGASLARLLVVEGYMDVLALVQFGVRNVVATLGTATTREHLERLFRVAGEVVFCFDGDAAGQRAAWRALETTLPLLGEGRQASFLFLPQGEDPDTLVRREGPAVFEDSARATPLSDFFFDQLLSRTDRQSTEGRARLADLARPLLATLPEEPFRRLMFQRLGELTRLAPEDLDPQAPRPAGPRGPARRSPPGGRNQRLSLVATAVQLLLHRPALAGTVTSARALAECDLAGAGLLAELVEFLQAHPHLTGAMVVEHWRGTEHEAALSRLLGRECLLGEDQREAEFRAAVAAIERRAGKAALDGLPSRPSELAEEAKAQLRKTMSERAKGKR